MTSPKTSNDLGSNLSNKFALDVKDMGALRPVSYTHLTLPTILLV